MLTYTLVPFQEELHMNAHLMSNCRSSKLDTSANLVTSEYRACHERGGVSVLDLKSELMLGFGANGTFEVAHGFHRY